MGQELLKTPENPDFTVMIPFINIQNIAVPSVVKKV